MKQEEQGIARAWNPTDSEGKPSAWFSDLVRVLSSNAAAKQLPHWLSELDDEDLQFIRRFVLLSGSLKDLAGQYGVSYPTVRSRLDRLIKKIEAAEANREQSVFERRLRVLVSDGQLSPTLAKQLLAAHRSTLSEISQVKSKGEVS